MKLSPRFKVCIENSTIPSETARIIINLINSCIEDYKSYSELPEKYKQIIPLEVSSDMFV